MTLAVHYRLFLESLYPLYDRREARQITNIVFERVTGYTYTKRMLHEGEELPANKEAELDKMKAALTASVPLQYVLEEAWFYKNPFYVNKAVLIPRPETEELVDWILKDNVNAGSGKSTFQLLDIGTGSGCIALSIKKNAPEMEVWATDKYEVALQVARKNAASLGADTCFVLADVLREGWEKHLPLMDVIVSNPPYIPLREKADLQAHVTRQEPETALFVPDTDPLIFYKAVLLTAQRKLKPGGTVYVEVHEDFGPAVKALFEETLTAVILKKDLNGKDRMVRGQFPG